MSLLLFKSKNLMIRKRLVNIKVGYLYPTKTIITYHETKNCFIHMFAVCKFIN
jgi:hypothetical protein